MKKKAFVVIAGMLVLLPTGKSFAVYDGHVTPTEYSAEECEDPEFREDRTFDECYDDTLEEVEGFIEIGELPKYPKPEVLTELPHTL